MLASTETDAGAVTITLTAGFPVSVQRLWDAFADVRQLERFWGAPSSPATFARHDFFPGGRSAYTEARADGAVVHGRWEWAEIEPLSSFDILDEDAEEFGESNRDLPSTRIVGTVVATDDGAALTLVFHFASRSALAAAVERGATERIDAIAAQLGEVLADADAFALPPSTKAVSETLIRISCFVQVSVEDAWRAYQDAELLSAWLYEPAGWKVQGALVATRPGEAYRYEWENPATGERSGREGEVLEILRPHRLVTSGRPIGEPGDGSINTVTFTAVDGGTVLSQLTHCPTREQRDKLLASGFAEGFERALGHLETAVRAAR